MFLSSLPLKRWTPALRLTPAPTPAPSSHEPSPSLGGEAVSTAQSCSAAAAKAQQPQGRSTQAPQQTQHVGMRAASLETLKRQMLQASRLRPLNDRLAHSDAVPRPKASEGLKQAMGTVGKLRKRGVRLPRGTQAYARNGARSSGTQHLQLRGRV